MDCRSKTDDLVGSLLSTLPLRSKSLLVSVWGDSISPHGGTVWLGKLIELMAPFGVNERSVRTSVYRLQQEKILSSVQKGRRSQYSLTDNGKRVFEEATGRIYSANQPEWTGQWSLLISHFEKNKRDQRLRYSQKLQWQGFGQIERNVFARPIMVGEIPVAPPLPPSGKPALQMMATRLSDTGVDRESDLVKQLWDMDNLRERYQQFIDHFSELDETLENGHMISNSDCFLIRSLLVHDFRRVLLRAPTLPVALLPKDWEGHRARVLFMNVYQKIWHGAEAHLISCLDPEIDAFQNASEEFYTRFGGLKQQE